MKKKLYIVTDNNNNNNDDAKEDFLKKKFFIICEKCRKFLGKYDNKYEIITWTKININNCYCK